MGINRIEVKDYRVLKGEYALDCCEGVNVLIGENATGKTTLLRAVYREYEHDNGRHMALHRHNNRVLAFKSGSEIKECVFIPEKDMLSHSKGLLPLWNDRNMPFMKHEIDIIAKAQMPETRELKPNAIKLLDKINKIIGGEVLYEDDAFFTLKENGEKIMFCVEASGFRKFGLLWKLLRNGLLEAGSVLLWDEPENSLNPEMIPALVAILLELADNGVQLFIATHDYNIARYFDVRKNKHIPVRFFNFSKDETGLVTCASTSRYIKITNNRLESASADLFQAVVADALGVDEDA